MPRYFLEIAYKGTAYHGWQKQPDSITVQGVLEESLCRILRHESCLTTGCGRTDTGVHASSFFLHFDLDSPIDHPDLVHALNGLLPKDIAVFRIFEVSSEAHARFDAQARKYIYRIHQRKDAFVNEDSSYMRQSLDVEKMNKAAALLLEHEDFASFAKAHGNHYTTLCNITEARWQQEEHRLEFHITADRFLRNMVRAIVGTLMEVGQSRMDIQGFREVLLAKDRTAAGKSASADGLYLHHIRYPYTVSYG